MLAGSFLKLTASIFTNRCLNVEEPRPGNGVGGLSWVTLHVPWSTFPREGPAKVWEGRADSSIASWGRELGLGL